MTTKMQVDNPGCLSPQCEAGYETCSVCAARKNDIVYRLRKRAEIRRQIPDRKSVREGKPDRMADLLDEAADEIERLRGSHV